MIGLHNLQGQDVNEEIDFHALPTSYRTNSKVDFSKGNKMVAFISVKCKHCINAANKFVLLDSKQEINNLYFVVGSKKEEGLIQFIDDTKNKWQQNTLEDIKVILTKIDTINKQ